MGNYERNPLMADFSVDYFETKDGVRLRYLHKGEGMPFILLHGYSDDADMWMLNAPAYADQYAVYCIDQRGHANSPALHGARISRLGADLHEFIESLGVPKVNLMGHSMGCSVIWSYIDIFGQDKINKVIFDDEPPMLVSNPNFTQEDIMRTGSNPMDPWALANAVAEGGLAWQPGSPFFEVFPSCFKRGILVFKDEEYAAMPDGYLEKLAQRPAMPDTTPEQNVILGELLKDHLMLDWRDLMPTIKVPVMYVTGDISNATTLELGQWMQETIPNCKWVRFSAAEYGNHDLAQNAYKRFNREVLAFLKDH